MNFYYNAILLLLLALFFLNCQHDVQGCMDNQACNYNQNATISNNSCQYPLGVTCDCNENSIYNFCDCDGNILDDCGICGGVNNACPVGSWILDNIANYNGLCEPENFQNVISTPFTDDHGNEFTFQDNYNQDYSYSTYSVSYNNHNQILDQFDGTWILSDSSLLCVTYNNGNNSCGEMVINENIMIRKIINDNGLCSAYSWNRKIESNY